MDPVAPGSLAPSSGIDAWAELALAELTRLPDASRVGVALTEGGGRRLLFTASDRRRDTGTGWCHVDAFAAVPLNDSIRSAEPVTGALDELGPRYEAYVAAQDGTGFAAVATVPFVTDADGEVLGGFVVYYGRAQPFDARQHAELREVAAGLSHRLRDALRRAPRPSRPDHGRPEGSLVAEHRTPPDLAAVADARRFLHRTLAAWDVDEETTSYAVLCLSELVTNAVIHTTGGCHVLVELHDGVLTSRVHDNGAVVSPAVVASHEPVQAHGHGLRVVAALSTRWGRSPAPDGAEAWFELEVS
ncbi:MAG: ATP-binding protein [Aeromicrobium sp.]